ncbi:MAG: secretion protein HlyD [Granulosicoccus sp.]|nr:secretion protein HlyD [Granulosicoccus sp.]
MPKKRIALLLLIGLLIALVVLRLWPGNDATAHLLYGNVDVRDVQLAFRTTGRIASLAVDEGTAVQPGEVLARLEPDIAEESQAVARANLAQASAQLASLKAGARPQEIAQARASVRNAQATFDNAASDAKRQESLIRTQSTSQTALDGARAARDRAAAQLASAREALALLEAGARVEDIAAAEAAVTAAQARLAQAATSLADTTLLAPSPGIILTRARERGSFVQAGQPVFAMALTDRVYIRAYVDEPRLGAVAPGTEVLIHSDSSQRSYIGQIGFVSPQAEFTPKSVQTPELRTDLVYRLRIVVKDADSRLRQGMPVTIELPE